MTQQTYRSESQPSVELRCPVRPINISVRLFTGWGPQA